MYEIHWSDCHGRFISVADSWREMEDLIVWLQSRGCVVTGTIKVK